MQAASLALEYFDPTDFSTMATAIELTTKVATLEERVANHVKFFWVVVGAGFIWLGTITGLIINTKNAIGGIGRAQANQTVDIVASLLSKPASKTDAASNLSTVSEFLKTANITGKKPDESALSNAADKLLQTQHAYPELPEVWQATAAFINFKSRLSSHSVPNPNATCRMTLGGLGWVFENCNVSLEDLAQHITGSTVNGKPAPFVFVNSKVHYRGGPIPAQSLTFVNCAFEFQVPSVPHPTGKTTMELLTASDLRSKVDIPL